MAKLRAHTRDDLLAATQRSLERIKARVDAAKLAGKDKIGVAVGKVVNTYKVAKHFELFITDNSFTFARLAHSIAAEAALDGLYIIRTSVEAARISLDQDDGPEGATDSSPPRGAGASQQGDFAGRLQLPAQVRHTRSRWTSAAPANGNHHYGQHR